MAELACFVVPLRWVSKHVERDSLNERPNSGAGAFNEAAQKSVGKRVETTLLTKGKG